MNWRYVRWGGVVAAVLSIGGFAAWIASLPAAPRGSASPPIDRQEVDAAVAALKPPKRSRPLIAIVALNEATETTDYIVPYGILRRAGIADVMTVATEAGRVTLFPALQVQPDTTLAAFDAQHPDGADYVIVPAMSRDDDRRVMQWLKGQATKGATVVAVCAGAKVVAAAGLLDGRRATTHWYSVKGLFEKHPAAEYVPDRRLVVDGRVATTTGITASMPMMLTLIEAIAGRAKAESVAADLGVKHWDATHSSSGFVLTRRFALTVLSNKLAFWNREHMGIELRPGDDEVALALTADAWSRTYRSRAFTFAASSSAVETRNGLRIVPDRVATMSSEMQRLTSVEGLRPVEALDRALHAIAERYGGSTAEVVAMQLEYPRSSARSADRRPANSDR